MFRLPLSLGCFFPGLHLWFYGPGNAKMGLRHGEVWGRGWGVQEKASQPPPPPKHFEVVFEVLD